MDYLFLPTSWITRKHKLLSFVFLYCRIYRQCVNWVHRSTFNWTNNNRRPDDIPFYLILTAVLEQHVFLHVIEIWFDQDSWIGFNCRGVDWPKMYAVVLCTSLKEESFRPDRGELECIKTISEEFSWVVLANTFFEKTGKWKIPLTLLISSALDHKVWFAGGGWMYAKKNMTSLYL